MDRYRVFLCYAGDDKELADRVDAHLYALHCTNTWDETLPACEDFREEIKTRIGWSHAFIALLTSTASGRPWVHQETGYAVAMNVPVIRLVTTDVVGDLDDMVSNRQAIPVDPELRDLGEKLTRDVIERAVHRSGSAPQIHPRFAQHPEPRADQIVAYIDLARDLPGSEGNMRIWEQAAFSTFSIPNAHPSAQRWKQRQDGGDPLTEHHRELLWQQRQVVEAAATCCGCDLILTPTVRPKDLTPLGVRTHIDLVLEFLEDMLDCKVRVAMRPKMEKNLLIVGDWFTAESHRPVPPIGFEQTNFEWHAPSVRKTIKDFDKELQSLLREAGVSELDSRRAAIEELEQVRDSIPDGAW